MHSARLSRIQRIFPSSWLHANRGGSSGDCAPRQGLPRPAALEKKLPVGCHVAGGRSCSPSPDWPETALGRTSHRMTDRFRLHSSTPPSSAHSRSFQSALPANCSSFRRLPASSIIPCSVIANLLSFILADTVSGSFCHSHPALIMGMILSPLRFFSF